MTCVTKHLLLSNAGIDTLHHFMKALNHSNVKFVTKYKFSQKCSLKTHIALVHERKQQQCKICDKFYSERSNLNRHTASVHKGNNKVKY